jgi:hypothetical protein
VVLTDAPPDHSSQREAKLVRSGNAGVRRVFATPHVSIWAVPHPWPIVTGPGRARLLALRDSRLAVHVSRGGTYRIAVRWSHYWHASMGCLDRGRDGMLQLRTTSAGTVRIGFDVDLSRLLDAFVGTSPSCKS